MVRPCLELHSHPVRLPHVRRRPIGVASKCCLLLLRRYTPSMVTVILLVGIAGANEVGMIGRPGLSFGHPCWEESYGTVAIGHPVRLPHVRRRPIGVASKCCLLLLQRYTPSMVTVILLVGIAGANEIGMIGRPGLSFGHPSPGIAGKRVTGQLQLGACA
ncbi:hypothetical protein EDB83DRAFT_1934176 [Lactarius deliciosus]|nr:hypothetical protein EDB83DRAFT_1934176 [Lactarius deliciosus]